MRRFILSRYATLLAVSLLFVAGFTLFMFGDPRLSGWYLVEQRDDGSGLVLVGGQGWEEFRRTTRRQHPQLRLGGGSLVFIGNHLRGTVIGSCNYLLGDYELNLITRTISFSKVGETLIDCGVPRLHSIKFVSYAPLLATVQRYECDWKELRLYADGDQPVLVFHRQPATISLEPVTRWIPGWLRDLLPWPV